jgi:uncharacterized protein (DUF169 family)
MLVCAHGAALQGVKELPQSELLSHGVIHIPKQVFTYWEQAGLKVTDWPAQKSLGVVVKQAVGARLTVTVVVAVASPQPPPKVARTQ